MTGLAISIQLAYRLLKFGFDAIFAVLASDCTKVTLALATLSIQISMIANSIWGFPHRNISEMATAFR